MRVPSPLKVARWVLAALVLPALIYLLGANLFLRFGLPWVFKSTNTVNVTAHGAWTIWPGVVHARGVRVVFQDYNLQWSLDLDQVQVRIALRELLSKTFHATEVTGTGTVFRMRNRIEPESRNAPWVSALPSIPEFPGTAVFEARVPEAPVSDADYALWTLHLEHVDVGVREIWAHLVRYREERGGARARGAFRLRPARSVWVEPASLTLSAGRVTLGNEELVSSLSGKITCTVHPFDVRVPDGRQVLRFITTELELSGQNATPDPILRLFWPDSGLSLDTVPGALSISARVRRGRFGEGSFVHLASPRVHSQYRGFRLDARQVVVHLAAQAGERAESSLGFAEAELATERTHLKPAQIRGALAVITTSGLDTAAEVTQVERRFQLAHVEVPDARLLDALGDAMPFRAGGIGFQLEARERDGVLEGTTHAQLRNLLLVKGRLEARLDGKLVARLFDAHQSDGSGRLTVDARLSPSRLFVSSEDNSKVALSEAGSLHLSADLHRNAQGRVQSQFQVASPNLSAMQIRGAQQRKVAQLTNLQLSGKLNRSASGRLDAQLTLRSPRVRALIGETWLRARSNLTLALTHFDAARESGHVESELLVSEGAAVSEGGSDCPWGTLPDARIRLDLAFTRASAQAKVNASLAEARFTWGDFHALGRVELAARIDALDRQQRTGVLEFSTRVTRAALSSGANERTGWEAKIPELVLSGKIAVNRKLSGTLTLSAAKTAARIGLTRMQTDFHADTALSSVDLARREAHFSGNFSLKNARLSAGNERVEGWWANIHADSALLIARDNLDLSVPFRADLRDGRPGMAVLAAEGSLPTFIADALPLRQLAVTGTVSRRCRLTNFRFTQASGGPLVARGFLNSTSDAVRGAFLVRLDAMQALSAGVELDPDEAGVALLAGDDWLRTRTQTLEDMVRRTLDKPCPTLPATCGGEADSN